MAEKFSMRIFIVENKNRSEIITSEILWIVKLNDEFREKIKLTLVKNADKTEIC